jgi:hypothetical protein
MSTRSLLAALVIGAALLWLPGPTVAETVGEVFRMVMGEQLVVGGDIILTVQGIPIGDVTDHRRVRDVLGTVPPGGEFSMTILRLGQVIDLKGRHP